MSDINYLPRNYNKSFRRVATPLDAVRNSLLMFDPSYHSVYTHFLGDANPTEWAAAKTNGTGAAVTVASSKLTLTTGTVDDGYAGQGFGLFWKGDYGFYMAAEFTTPSAITTLKFEVGVTDAVDDAGAVNVKATPTATATDFCVLVFDTDDNTQLDLISQKASGVAANAENVITVAASTSYVVEMRGQGDAVSVFVNGNHVGAGNIEGGNLITPWIFAQSRAGTASRVLTCDWMVMTGPVA